VRRSSIDFFLSLGVSLDNFLGITSREFENVVLFYA